MISMQCTIPLYNHDTIQLAHGGGGKLTQQLIGSLFYKYFKNEYLEQEHDSAQLVLSGKRIAFTTDSFVVDPVFFPGGNIGDLAVNGTINDLLCSGATPQYLSAGFIIEEGFPMKNLEVIVETMAKAAKEAGVYIVTGDTKVIERNRGNQIYINTSGIGVIPDQTSISPLNAKPGDSIIVTGNIGEHGVCILSTRNNLGFESEVKSDTAALTDMVSKLMKQIPDVHVLRDPTRGGLSSTLNEIAQTAHVGIEIEEDKLPVSTGVNAACELLGMDPLFVANEGLLLVFVAKEDTEQALHIIRESKHGANAQIIGKVTESNPGIVLMKGAFGNKRIIEMISGEQLPRIC